MYTTNLIGSISGTKLFYYFLQETKPEKKTNIKRKVLKAVVTLMFITIVVGVIIIWSLHESSGKDRSDLKFYFDPEDLKLFISRFDKDTSLGTLGGGALMSKSLDALDKCPPKRSELECYHWEDNNKITLIPVMLDDVKCLNISWLTVANAFPEDCYNIKSGFWFGNMQHSWPNDFVLQKQIVKFGMTDDESVKALEYLWISSHGIGIYLLNDGPYSIRWNVSGSDSLCFSSASKISDVSSKRHLNYLVCQGYDAKNTWKAIRKHVRNYPQNVTEKFLTSRTDSFLWSMQANESQTYIDSVASSLKLVSDNQFQCNTIDLPANWEGVIGDLTFSSNMSSDVQLAIQNNADCDFVLPILPFCSFQSDQFLPGIKNNRFLHDTVSNGIKLVDFESDTVAVWDIYNPAVASWITGKLQQLSSQYNIKHFKLNKFPDLYMMGTIDNTSTSINRTFYTRWLDLLSVVSDSLVVEEIYRSQEATVYIEISGKVSRRNSSSCILSTIPYALTANLYGYPFVMSVARDIETWSEELYFRWLQMSIFFPSIKIPTAIMHFSEHAISYTRNMSTFRNDFVVPKLQFMRDIHPNQPVIRPVFWIEPLDDESYAVTDQFLFGDDILVAPVICEEVTTLNIYLPPGDWTDPVLNIHYEGKKWLYNVEVNATTFKYYILKKRWPIVDRNMYDL